jgi:hypothetical protein
MAGPERASAGRLSWPCCGPRSSLTCDIAREYFMRADQGRPDILELFHEDAEIYFPQFGFGSGRNSFLEMVKGFEGTLEAFNTTTTG